MFHWIHEAASVLENAEGRPTSEVRSAYQGWKERFAEALKAPTDEAIRHWGEHCLKITQSYWVGLFCAYDVPDLPRTNNDLEHLFRSLRHQERRITGRKVASPSLVVRGAVRVLAATLTWVNPPTPIQLGEVDPVRWREERRRLGKVRHARVMQRRFRQHPDTYLAALEEQLLKLSLPP